MNSVNQNNQNKLTMFNFFFLWFGAAMSIAEIMTGGLLAPLGFRDGLFVILLGHLVGVFVLILGGVIGFEAGLPSLKSTRISFGVYGSYLFSIFNVLQLIGWTAIMIISGGRSVNIISKVLWSFDNVTFWSILIGLMICLWIFFGNTGFKKINTIAVLLLLTLTAVLSMVVFKNDQLFSLKAVGEMSFGTAFELNVIMPLSWLPLIADYTRYARSKKEAVTGSFLGYFLGSSWMYIIGLSTGILFENPDLGAIMMAANLGFTALGIIVLSTVTTTFLDAYSAGVTFLNIMPKWDEKKVAVGMGIVGIAVAILVPIEQFENFLYAIGSVFAPMFAILFTDYFIIKKRRKIQNKILINWGSMLIWIFGIFLYYTFIKLDFVFGTTIPVMLVTSVVYKIFWRWIKNWKYEMK
ncbi:MAG: putative hydroxymethylpyrimidine transporter CytX [Clostridia bacterium]|nr:putative hydroxymethylpyrimidine transporter CytX [Clostridia bacterium]